MAALSVLFIAAAVGFLLNALLPGIPLAACFALGAVVAPPDAIAATAVARRIGLPRRIVVVLEGESLLNDATAIVTFRVAVAAVVSALRTGTRPFRWSACRIAGRRPPPRRA